MSRDLIRYSPLVVAGVLLAASAWVGAGYFSGYEDYLRYLIRETAYISSSFFLLAYLARPLLNLTAADFARVLMRIRRQLGLAAALAHTVHFGVVVAWVRFTGEVVEPATLLFGGLGFLMFWLLAATSNNASVQWLGPNWKRLHRFGIHYIWFIYIVTYAGGLSAQPVYWLFVALFVVGLIMRIHLFVSLRPTAAVQ
jgi:DMSO/TMAO reductase YedYZ heme-binding membrane subunit